MSEETNHSDSNKPAVPSNPLFGGRQSVITRYADRRRPSAGR